jgi:phosphate-selective porin OprO/OprP
MLRLGWTLTGETRSFKATDGEFKRLKPSKDFDPDKGTWGAWEVALRHDGIDLKMMLRHNRRRCKARDFKS